ncbi:alpha-amylase family glycosyl hydrolase [Geobacter sp.]|uniref:alpha-amylase family glycosyl hydrolase n=1 Tax=Geobacter sp. TaxID=46610 RepID=UPI0027B98391|nr:alpha-amylase family glycosyl hydrolase [Geobacter sp.]
MRFKRVMQSVVVGVVALWFSAVAFAGEQPVAIFHSFNEKYADVEKYVCSLAKQGYSHIQIAPAQKSNPAGEWWARYQPVDYSVIEGRGTEQELKRLIVRAHRCKIKVIADVVFNHMASMPEYQDLNYPQFGPEDFHPPCDINYQDGTRDTEVDCWLGGLPDLDLSRKKVRDIHQAHIKKLLKLGIDGFRFDAAKHMSPEIVKSYIDYIDSQSKGKTWNYLEVIEDGDTSAERYNWIAAVTDFLLYNSMKGAFSFGGDLRTLAVPPAVNDPRSVTFGQNHDTIRALNANAINPYNDPADSYLATAYVLARENGTPLVLAQDNLAVPYIKYGVAFRRIMRQRGAEGKGVRENVLAVTNSPTVLVMERGAEGFFVVNKGAEKFDVPTLDLTFTNLEGCYRELRNNFTVAVERRADYKKYVTRWGTWTRGGMEVQARDALYFIREPWEKCK